MRFTVRRYDDGRLVAIEIAGGRIAAVSPLDGSPPQDVPWVSPAFVDLQVNGHGGHEFSSQSLTTEIVADIAAAMNAYGVARFCPTLTTAGRSVLAHALATIAAACDQHPATAQRIAGIHLEGPYISREDGPRGAHPAEHCRPPDWDEFQRLQESAAGRIRIVTLAPEFPDAAEFIANAVKSGVLVAIGHTAADSAQIRAAVDAGARMSTHLGNGCHRTLRRHPNYLWDQLADDRLSASLIADGHHLPAEVVQTFVRAKTPERCLLVSDLSGLTGLPPGRYQSQLCELDILPDGRLVVAGQDQLLAGALRPIGYGVANVIRFAGVDLRTAVDMASRRPAELIGMPVGELAADRPADLVLFDLPAEPDQPLRIRATIVGGQAVYGKATTGSASVPSQSE